MTETTSIYTTEPTDPTQDLADRLQRNPTLGREALRLYFTMHMPDDSLDFDSTLAATLDKNSYDASKSHEPCQSLRYAGSIIEIAQHVTHVATKGALDNDPGSKDDPFLTVVNNYVPLHVTSHKKDAREALLRYLTREKVAQTRWAPRDVRPSIESSYVFHRRVVADSPSDCRRMDFTRALYATLQEFEEEDTGSVDGFEQFYLELVHGEGESRKDPRKVHHLGRGTNEKRQTG